MAAVIQAEQTTRTRGEGPPAAGSFVEQVGDEHVFLVGRPPIGEYLGFVQGLAINGHAVDLGELTEEWRKANDHVRALETTEAGIADAPPMRELPPDLAALATELMQNPMFRRVFRFVPSRIALVELDRLMVFQKNINLRYVEELKARLGHAPSPASTFRLALSLDRVEPPVCRLRRRRAVDRARPGVGVHGARQSGRRGGRQRVE